MTTVENPVMDDLNKLVNHCNPTIVKRESNNFVIDAGEIFSIKRDLTNIRI